MIKIDGIPIIGGQMSAQEFAKKVKAYNLPNPGDKDWDKDNPDTSYNCSVCHKPTKHNEKYDAYYCVDCNRWNEDGCKDSNCMFCSNRPEKPL